MGRIIVVFVPIDCSAPMGSVDGIETSPTRRTARVHECGGRVARAVSEDSCSGLAPMPLQCMVRHPSLCAQVGRRVHRGWRKLTHVRRALKIISASAPDVAWISGTLSALSTMRPRSKFGELLLLL